ncbi:hypothetical protein NX774_12090 [Massilia agilis]|uniref:Bacterial toxin YdaT domain-containing protein n=1 Tax=Massilia agilis TaxID=1811226 RepID=A0ABT2DBI8_9BURK|nr:hypothetical protein [Massilia agilis]MCS0808660.1 hypothetical protein [Massilia agilis]
MKSNPQPQAATSILRTEIENWRNANGLSRESVAISVIEAHARLGADIATGITFDSSKKDAYDRAKTAAQKLYRWLDEAGNLPADMLISVVAILPADLQLHVLNQIMRPLALEARSTEQTFEGCLDAATLASSLVKEQSEAVVAVLAAGNNQTPEALIAARKEAVDLAESTASTIRAIDAELAKHDNKLRAVG